MSADHVRSCLNQFIMHFKSFKSDPTITEYIIDANGKIGNNKQRIMIKKISGMGQKWLDDIFSRSNMSRNLGTVNAAYANKTRKNSLLKKSHMN